MEFIDRGQRITKFEKTPQGYLKVKVYLCRTGLYTYTGKELGQPQEMWDRKFQVYRSPEEVFKTESMETFKNMPATDDHPAKLGVDGKPIAVMLDSTNTKDYARGYTGNTVDKVKLPYSDDLLMDSTAIITDKELIDGILSGEKSEVSCGYDARLRPSKEGEQGDFVMEGMVGNHLAFLPKGRAGQLCSIHDSKNKIEDIEMYDEDNDVSMVKGSGVPNSQPATAKVQVKDGGSEGFPELVEHNPDNRGNQVNLDPKSGKNMTGTKPHIKSSVLDSSVPVEDRFGMVVDYMGENNRTFSDSLNGLTERLGSLETTISDALEGLKKPSDDDDKDDKDDKDKKMDKKGMKDGAPLELQEELVKAQKEIGKLQAIVDNAPTPEKIAVLAKSYAQATKTAMKIAPSLQITDSMSEQDIRLEACKKVNPNVEWGNKSSDYVEAYFDSLAERGGSVHPMLDQISRSSDHRNLSDGQIASREATQAQMDDWKK